MKKKLLTLLTLLVAVCSGAWAQTEICSATLNGITSNSNTSTGVSQTGCTMKWNSVASTGSDIITINSVNYYKFSGSSSYVQLILNDNGEFQAGDILTVTACGKESSSKTIGFSLKSDSQSAAHTGSATNSATTDIEYTLTAGDIEEDGSIKIFRAGYSNVRFGDFKVVRPAADSRTAVTLSFGADSGSFDINGSETLPTLTATPNETAITSNISYSTSNSAVATISASGAITLKGIGTTTITASFAGDTNYKPASATYTLTVTDATKLGYAEVLNPDDNTLAARWLFGIEHASVTQAYGSKMNDYPNRSVTVYLNGNQYTNNQTWYKTVNTSTYDNDQWVGYDVTIEDGYVLNLSNVDARFLVSDDCVITWKVVISDQNDTELYTSSNLTTRRSSTANLSQSFSLSTLTGTIHVRIFMYQGGSTKGFSIEKLILTGATAVDTRDTYTISYAAGEGTGVAPSDEDVREGDSYKVAKPYFLAKDGKTFTGWVSGENTYTAGQIFTPAADMTLTAQFEDNQASLSASTAATTVLWDFQKGNTTEFNLASGTFVTQATINGKTVDMPLAFDKQIRNDGWADWAIVTNGTKMTIPAVKGMTLTMLTYENPIAPTRTMTTIAGEDLTSENVTGTANPYTVTYTYDGSASTIDIVFNAGYIRTLAVAYPKTQAAKPTMAAGTFNFENKIMPVTITAADGETLYVSNGSEFAVQTSPYEANVAAGVTCSAKTSLDGGTTFSEVASYSNEFDASKKYVAWAFESSYSGYAFADDPMATELKSIYNVIPVNAYTEDMENADLIVLTEAVDGKGTFAKSMKGFVGSTPMINLKFFAYTKGTGNNDRWNWGAPSNNTGKYTITPESALYKVLDGVTFESDGSVKLYDNSPSGNVIQTVLWDGDPTDFPASNVDMGMTSDKVSMHASDKFFGLGLSCDNKANYSANALTIIKNAAAMLIAGEDLTTEVATVSGTITASNYNTFSSSYALDLSTISVGTAYVATSVTDGKVVLSKSTAVVPAGTGLMIAGSANDVFTIETTKAASTLTADNLLVGMPNGGEVEVAATGYNYVFGWTDASNPGFYKVTSDKPTLSAGKAYLHTTEALSTYSPARLAIAFEDESTGIAEMQAVKSIENGKFYNLNGQQVAQPTKGLYIVNGKKVMVK